MAKTSYYVSLNGCKDATTIYNRLISELFDKNVGRFNIEKKYGTNHEEYANIW